MPGHDNFFKSGENRCLYLILSVVPVARNSKHLSWEAANRGVQIAKVRILKNRCRSSRIEAAMGLPRQGAQAVVRAAPAARVPTAVLVINQDWCAGNFSFQREKSICKLYRKGFHA